MNRYTHALVKESAAQALGFEPSPMWGRFTSGGSLIAPKSHYKAIMRSLHPENIIPGKAVDHVVDLAKKAIKDLPAISHVRSNAFNFGGHGTKK